MSQKWAWKSMICFLYSKTEDGGKIKNKSKKQKQKQKKKKKQ